MNPNTTEHSTQRLLKLLQAQGMLKIDRCIEPSVIQEVAVSFFDLLASQKPQSNIVTRNSDWHLVKHTRQSKRCKAQCAPAHNVEQV